jgi:hypothetical protein
MHGQRRYIIVFLTVAFLSTLYLVTDFESVPDADATGGAFEDTKHGGGTVDGFPHSGVDRSVNPDHFPFYSGSPDAGQYNPAECVHCHEPHNLFGGVSQDPESSPQDSSAGTPDPYLLFGDNTNELCWYCHENINFDPFYGGGVGAWRFYQGQLIYESASHGVSTSFRWPDDTDLTNDGTIWPRNYARPPGDAKKCINCHTPHGIKDTTNTGHDFGTISNSNYVVGTDPTPSSKELIYRQTIAREDALCLNCHDTGATEDSSTGPAALNIKDQVDKWGYVAPTQYDTTPGTGHPVREITYYDRHDLANEDPGSISSGWFTAANRHAECTDCHNPHAAEGRGSGMTSPYYGFVFQSSGGTSWNSNRYDSPSDSTSSPVKIGPVNKGVWGVTVTTSTGDITGTVDSLEPASNHRLYQLCLKCHSYWAWGGSNLGDGSGEASWDSPTSTETGWSTVDSTFYTARTNLNMTNQAWEFATNRKTNHAVFGEGKHKAETWTAGGIFTNGTRNPCWCAGTVCPPTVTSYETNNEGEYGTGACTNDNATTHADGTRTDVALSTLSNNFVPPWRHTSRLTCTDCHEDDSESTARGPHGSSRPFLIRGLDTSISYSLKNDSFSYSSLPAAAGNNLCLNCHRADIYSYEGNTSALTYQNFARLPHPPLDNGNVGRIWSGKDTPNGIVCMMCHGGARQRLGLIHGSDRTATLTTCGTRCSDSARLLAINATGGDNFDGDWTDYVKARVGTAGTCVKNSTNICGHGGDGATSDAANYDY